MEREMPRRRWILSFCIALMACAGVQACRQDIPKGVVRPSKIEVEVDGVQHLQLEVASKYATVRNEIWKVEPESLGTVYYNQAEPERRNATFRGAQPGTGRIVVMAFYEQGSAAVAIAEVPVTVK
jgi:hypothetical protein